MNGQIETNTYIEDSFFQQLSTKTKNRVYFFSQGYLKNGEKIKKIDQILVAIQDISEALMQEMEPNRSNDFINRYIIPIMVQISKGLEL